MSGAGRCAVCRDPQRRALEQAHIGGASIRSLAREYGRDKSTIQQARSEIVGKKIVHAVMSRVSKAADQRLFISFDYGTGTEIYLSGPSMKRDDLDFKMNAVTNYPKRKSG